MAAEEDNTNPGANEKAEEYQERIELQKETGYNFRFHADQEKLWLFRKVQKRNPHVSFKRVQQDT